MISGRTRAGSNRALSDSRPKGSKGDELVSGVYGKNILNLKTDTVSDTELLSHAEYSVVLTDNEKKFCGTYLTVAFGDGKMSGMAVVS